MSVALPRPGALLVALGGFASLGAVAGLRVDGGVAGAVLLTVVPAAGAVALTTPTLLVASAFAGVSAGPSEVAAAPLDAFVRAGRLAFWLCPVLLVFVPAGGLTLLAAFQGAVLGAAVVGLVVGTRALLARPDRPAPVLAYGWAAFTAAVGLHLFHSSPLA